MGRFGHENGPFWMLAGAVLVLFFLPLGPFWSGPFWYAWAVFDLHWGRFGDGPFWSVPASYSSTNKTRHGLRAQLIANYCLHATDEHTLVSESADKSR